MQILPLCLCFWKNTSGTNPYSLQCKRRAALQNNLYFVYFWRSQNLNPEILFCTSLAMSEDLEHTEYGIKEKKTTIDSDSNSSAENQNKEAYDSEDDSED